MGSAGKHLPRVHGRFQPPGVQERHPGVAQRVGYRFHRRPSVLVRRSAGPRAALTARWVGCEDHLLPPHQAPVLYCGS